MKASRKAWTAVAVAGLCLGAGLHAGDGPPPKDGDGPRIGPAEGGRGQGAREGRDVRPRPPEGPPLLGDVKGMKEEVERHQQTMKELQDQIREVVGRPEDRRERGDRKEDIAGRRAALQAKVDEVAPKIIDEFIRHHSAVAELLKANRADAVERLKERMMEPPRGPDRRGDGPVPPFKREDGPPARGERGDGPPQGGDRGDVRPPRGDRGDAQPPGRRGDGPPQGGDRGEGRPGGPVPFFDGVEGARQEMDTHQENMKTLFDAVKGAVDAPRGRGGQEGPPDMEKARATLFAKIDEVAPQIVAEFIRHFGAMKDALGANQDAAAESLKKQMKQGHEDAVRRGGGPRGREPGPSPEKGMRERKADF